MTNEEHRTKNDVEVDYSRNLVAPQPRFSLLSYSSFHLLLISFNIEPWNLFLNPLHTYL